MVDHMCANTRTYVWYSSSLGPNKTSFFSLSLDPEVVPRTNSGNAQSEAVEAVIMLISQWFLKQVFFEFCMGLLNNVIPRRALDNTLMWCGQAPLELISDCFFVPLLWSALLSLVTQKVSIQKLSANAMLHHLDVLPNQQDICLKVALIRCWWNPRSWQCEPATFGNHQISSYASCMRSICRLRRGGRCKDFCITQS